MRRMTITPRNINHVLLDFDKLDWVSDGGDFMEAHYDFTENGYYKLEFQGYPSHTDPHSYNLNLEFPNGCIISIAPNLDTNNFDGYVKVKDDDASMYEGTPYITLNFDSLPTDTIYIYVNNGFIYVGGYEEL